MKYSETHEWIQIQGDLGVVGITTFAQNELKEIVSIQLPQIGKQVKAGEEIAILESTKAAVDLYSPVTGTVVAINEEIVKNPQFLNATSQEKGWLFKIRLQDLSELDQLLSREEYLENAKL